jgi:DNA-binding response OmpR family regulator
MFARIVHVGQDRFLIKMRSIILRQAGFVVDEAYTMRAARALSGLVDVVLICHTLPRKDREQLALAVREKALSVPVVCICSYPFEDTPDGCMSVGNAPREILAAMAAATNGTAKSHGNAA